MRDYPLTQVTGLTGTSTTQTIEFTPQPMRDPYVAAYVRHDIAAGSVDIKTQGSADGGTTWVDLDTAVSSISSPGLIAAVRAFPLMRYHLAYTTFGSSDTVDIQVIEY